MNKEVKNTRIILLVVDIYSIRLKKQFDKAKEIPRDLLTPKTRDKKAIFPFVTDFNPHLPNINKIITGLPVAQPSYKFGSFFPGTNCTLACSARARDIKECVE